MRVPRRSFLHMVGAAIALAGSRQAARAQDYPSRPVRLIVGFPASGLTDILARLLGQSLSERLGQQFIVEDRPGAGTNLAILRIARKKTGSHDRGYDRAIRRHEGSKLVLKSCDVLSCPVYSRTRIIK
jgi:tripartite-type tricarboxylate transporter receptor subunit TctC